jgi:hypothetical protein
MELAMQAVNGLVGSVKKSEFFLIFFWNLLDRVLHLW